MKILTLLKGDFKAQTLQNNHMNGDTAELPYIPPAREAVALASMAKRKNRAREEEDATATWHGPPARGQRKCQRPQMTVQEQGSIKAARF